MFNTAVISKPSEPRYLSGFQLSFHLRSSSLGMETFQRYKHLVVRTNALPFIRASGSKRVIRSAQSWAEGTSSVSYPLGNLPYRQRSGFSSAGEGLYPTKVNLIIPETVGPFHDLRFSYKLIRQASAGATIHWMTGCVLQR